MAIQMRRGEKKDFQPEKLKVGEFAVPTDTGEVYIKTSESTTKGIATLNSSGKLEQMPTYSDIGAAPKNHASSATTYGVSSAANYGHALASSSTPLVAGTANVGAETSKFARGDHVHPVQTSVSGNAGTATKLQTSRTIATSGGAIGTATSFNGSANITIPVTAINPTYLSSATPINKGGTGAATADAALSNLGAVPQSRTINNKTLSEDITLTPSDIGAAASSHGNHVPTTQTANNKVFLRNDNTWQNVTPANIGAVPTSRTINGKALSSNISLTASDVGAAASSHNHSASNITSGTLPIERGGTNATTATQALENLGGVPKTRTVNNKALSSDISLTASDVGASASNHSHAFSVITAKPTTLSGYGITDAVPTTRKVNNKSLSSDISLTASDVGAATSVQGTKADSAIQGIKVNGTLVSPDASKTVNIDATSLGGATTEQGEKADSAIQGIQGNGTAITPNANKIVNVTPSNIGAVPTSRTINSKALSSNISLTASDIGAVPYEVKSSTDFNNMTTPGIYTMRSSSTNSPSGDYNGLIVLKSDNGNYVEQIAVKEGTTQIYLRYLSGSTWSAWKQLAVSDHTHSASNITSGTLPVSRGGTGATSASTALSNLGMTISSGTWTPTLASREGTNPTYSLNYKYAMYYRVNNLVYVTFHMKVNITSAGTNYACIRGLPFTAASNMNGQALSIRECYGGISYYPACAHILDSSSVIYIQNSGGEAAQQWKTGETWIGFSGCYIKS